MNQAIRTANAAVRSEAEGAPVGTDHSKQAIGDYVTAMYPQNAAPAIGVHDAGHIPAAWITSTDNSALAQAKSDLFEKLVNPYCMGCHRVNALNFADYNVFQTLSADQGGKAVLKHYIEPDPTDPQRKKTVAMPQSELMFNNLRADGDALDAVEGWIVEAQDPSVPSCRVTFEVTGAGFTAYGQDIWIVGDQPEAWARGTRRWASSSTAAPSPPGTARRCCPRACPSSIRRLPFSRGMARCCGRAGDNHAMTVPARATFKVKQHAWRP